MLTPDTRARLEAIWRQADLDQRTVEAMSNAIRSEVARWRLTHITPPPDGWPFRRARAWWVGDDLADGGTWWRARLRRAEIARRRRSTLVAALTALAFVADAVILLRLSPD